MTYKTKSVTNTKIIIAFAVAVLAALLIPTAAQKASAACAALPTDNGTATATVNVPTTGSYRLWVRLKTADTTNNSLLMDIGDSNCGIVIGDTGITANQWTWVDFKNGSTATKTDVNLTAGSHTIRIAGREANVALDRVILVANANCTPTGTGDNCVYDATPTVSPTPTPSPAADITLVGLIDGQTVSGTVSLEARPVNATPTKFEFYVDTTLVNSDINPIHCLGGDNGRTCNGYDTTKLTDGGHTVKVVMTHSAGTVSKTLHITVRNTTAGKPGDITGDDHINLLDFNQVLAHWGRTDRPAGDVNQDGRVDVQDLNQIISSWGM